LRRMPLIFEKASLPLYASSRYIFWMTPLGAEDGLRRLAYRWLSRNCPSASVEVLTANRDRREESLCRELSAGSSEGKLLSTRNGEVLMDKAWVGVDAGKEFHWAHVLDASGRELLSRKVENDEADISKLIDEALSLAEEVLWAVDQPGGGAALLLALLWERDQRVLYIPGLTVDRARDTYRGESKTDARDARVIADQARMRPDLGELRAGEEEISELQLLLGRRRDLVTDQNRTITRLRETLLALFPALERALDLNRRGPLTLLTHYQSPARLRRAGQKRVAAYLRNRRVKGFNSVAQKALSAANSQNATLPAQDVASRLVAELAQEVLAIKDRIESIDEDLRQRFFARPEAKILSSLPGMGALLGAEFLVAVGDVSAFESADQLAAYAGLVPAAHDSGKRVGNNKRMRGGNKVLKRVFYQSAFSSLRSAPESRAFYDRKRAEGKRHTQALIALARRRVNVLWAMLRDGTTFEAQSAA
jgi:transposase